MEEVAKDHLEGNVSRIIKYYSGWTCCSFVQYPKKYKEGEEAVYKSDVMGKPFWKATFFLMIKTANF